MDYILILVLCLLATSKMSFQSFFGKQNVKNSADAIFFNAFVFGFSSLLFLPTIFGSSAPVWAYAAVAAVFTVLFQFFYTKALTAGNVSITVLIVNFNMVLNVLVSYIFFKEDISFFRLCGILLTIVSFIVCTRFESDKPSQKNWLLFTIIAMFSTAAGSIVQKFFAESQYGGENQAFVSCHYITATVIAMIIYGIYAAKGEKKTFKTDINVFKYAAAVGISLAVFQGFYTYAMANVDGTFLFPAYSGGAIVFSTISGVIIFKDKLSKKQITGVLLGLVSIVLMNF